jgi:hypothetical protein
MLLTSGCNTQVITGEAADRLRHPYPYGARWVKEGMTRESRKADWVACGGGVDLGDGFRKWIQPEAWESFWPQKDAHSKQLFSCMQSRGYDYKNPAVRDTPDECDARTCLYP